MKMLYVIVLFSTPLLAQQKSVRIDQVRSIEYNNGEVIVSFWKNNQVFRLQDNSHLLPCLENGWKAEKEVVMGMNKDAKVILNCKLYGGGIPRL